MTLPRQTPAAVPQAHAAISFMAAPMTAPMVPPMAALTKMMAKPTATLFRKWTSIAVPDRQCFVGLVCCVFITL